jgi:N-acetyl-anhydromuramyl-L-alanine amidase AmpD
MLINYKRRAKKYSYKTTQKGNAGSPIKRSLESIDAIIIHNVGEDEGKISTAKNNADYFATGNTRSAGAHFFIDRDGKCAKSVWIKNIAWSVGLLTYEKGQYYNYVNNDNSISIELCGIMKDAPTEKQLKKLDDLVKYLCKKCPNIKWICRHYDVVKKDCPERYVKDRKAWLELQCRLLTVMQDAMKKYHGKEV